MYPILSAFAENHFLTSEIRSKTTKTSKMNKYYKNTIGGKLYDFIEFIKINTPDFDESELNNIDALIHKIAQNLFYYENIETAKSDYISLIGLLMKKGVVFERHE